MRWSALALDRFPAIPGGGQPSCSCAQGPAAGDLRLTACRAAGFVPHESPGASSYFTPKAHVEHSNDTLTQASSSQRNPVISQLDREIAANPFRHRSSSDHLLRVGCLAGLVWSGHCSTVH